jgi:hypothetical protein
LLEDNRRGYICFKEMPARVSNFRESGIGNFNFAGGHKKIKEKVMKRTKWEMPGVKAGSRRAAAVTLTVLLAAVCGGCGNQYSVEDAVSRDEKFTLVGDAGEAQTKDISQATTTAMIAHEEPTAYTVLNWQKGKLKQRYGLGDTKLYGGFEMTVLNAWKLGYILNPVRYNLKTVMLLIKLGWYLIPRVN